MPTLIHLICPQCNLEFTRTKGRNTYLQKRSITGGVFCSQKCYNINRTLPEVVVPCLQCGNLVSKKQYDYKKFPNTFCNHSCAATYSNQHKKSGYRRSKLEIYLEEKTREEFPNVQLLAPNKTAIGSELDFYFPDLRFAIEFNGIFHYEPIYGKDKFEKIIENDKQKMIRCYEKGIELCIIDTSVFQHATKPIKEKYWNIVKTLLEEIIWRTGEEGIEPP